MSTLIQSECWKITGISPAQKIVIISLAEQANDHGVCWPSVANMGMRTCLSERAIRKALRDLENLGYLSTHQREGRSSYYTVCPAGNAPRQEMPPSPRQEVQGAPAAGAGDPGTSCPQNRKEPQGESQKQYTDDFEAAWSAYPRRAGGNPKVSAFRQWNARLKAGATPDEMIAGAQRYAAYIKATRKEGTEFVQLGSTFFGRDEHFREPWQLPDPGGDGPGRRHNNLRRGDSDALDKNPDGSVRF